MKKIHWIILLLIAAVAIISAGFLVFFSAEEDAIITVRYNDTEIVITRDILTQTTDKLTFPAVVRSSDSKPVETTYQGVEFNKLLSALGIDSANIDKVTFDASDHYRVILSGDEIRDPLNVYIVFERDGALMTSAGKNGDGPFQLVIRKDAFSQRWIKHLNEIIIEEAEQ
jgi:hypothetical protein